MHTLVGVGRVSRLILHRDRVRLPLWIAAVAGIVVISAWTLQITYPDQESVETYTTLFSDNPALVVFAGPGYGFDDPNLGVILVNEVQLWGCIGMAAMSIFLLNRHTRAEEDIERADLLRSSVVGRHAPTAAAVAVVAAANVAIAVVCGIGFVALGYAAVGSVALAGSLLVVGLVFVGVTAVAAQVASTSRGTLGLALLALVAAFVVRAIGDVGESWVRWLSPIAWAQSVRAFAGEQWWTLGLALLVAAGLVVAGFWLLSRRDIGSGMLATRSGRASAATSLGSPVGLATRLQRGTIVAWTIAMFPLGIVYGSIADDIERIVEENPVYTDFFEQIAGADLVDSFFATAVNMLAMFVAGFAVAATLKLHSEESAGRADPLLVASVPRHRWALSHVLLAAIGVVVAMAAAGLGVGVGVVATSGGADQPARLLGAALVTVPAVFVFIGLTLAVWGWWPRWAMSAWAALAAVLVIGILGEILRLPEWSRRISPFDHVPAVPAEDVSWLPLAVLLAVALALTALGLWGLARRDIHTT